MKRDDVATNMKLNIWNFETFTQAFVIDSG